MGLAVIDDGWRRGRMPAEVVRREGHERQTVEKQIY